MSPAVPHIAFAVLALTAYSVVILTYDIIMQRASALAAADFLIWCGHGDDMRPSLWWRQLKWRVAEFRHAMLHWPMPPGGGAHALQKVWFDGPPESGSRSQFWCAWWLEFCRDQGSPLYHLHVLIQHEQLKKKWLFVHAGLRHGKLVLRPTLVQVMTWCHQAGSHYLKQCWPKSMPPYGITTPQWVKYMLLMVRWHQIVADAGGVKKWWS